MAIVASGRFGGASEDDIRALLAGKAAMFFGVIKEKRTLCLSAWYEVFQTLGGDTAFVPLVLKP